MTYEESFIKQQLKPIILDLKNRSLSWEQIKAFIDEDIVNDVKTEFELQESIKREEQRLKNRVEFVLTKDHVKLLHDMWVSWIDREYGAPNIDCKRPYGNSDVEDDIRKILNKPKLTNSQCMDIHQETEFALQIMLQHSKLKLGKYSRKDCYTNQWESQNNTKVSGK